MTTGPTTPETGGEAFRSSFASPFGAGRFSIGDLARRRAHEAAQQALGRRDGAGEAGNGPGVADKWKLHRALVEARARYALSDRTLAVLAALLSALPGTEIDGSAPRIVFPSNAELSMRTGGMAPATLRRHLAALVAAGLVLRQDSPNGKRYCRRDESGAIADAFGFDLSPLALMAEEIHAAAEAERADARAKRRLREEITLHGRDMGRIVAIALAEGRAGDWTGLAARLAPLQRPLPRSAGLAALAAHRDICARLHAEIEAAFLASMTEHDVRTQEMSANDADFERHKQNSKPDSPFDRGSEKSLKRGHGENGRQGQDPDDRAGSGAEPNGLAGHDPDLDPDRADPVLDRRDGLTLADLLARCPQIADYGGGTVRTLADLVNAANLARAAMGISPDAWAKARATMGDRAAAVTIACMLERIDRIARPGGYLRALTTKAEQGRFSVTPMVRALST